MKKFLQKKIKHSFFLAALFSLTFFSVNAQVQVGSQTNESQAIPFDPYYGYSYTQSIYLQSEINATAAASITAIQWYFSGSSLSNNQDITIYMGHSSKTSFANTTDWEPIGNLTQVFTGSPGSPTSAGWITITLDTPFPYNNSDNLIIATDENDASYNGSSDDFQCSASTNPNQSLYYRDDSTNPDPTSPPSGIRISYISNVILEGLMPPPPPAEDICTGAIDIPVATSACSGITTGNNTSSTDSNNDVNTPSATCTDFGGGDIWFKLTVPASGNVTISGDASPDCCSYLWYEVYSGADCSALSNVQCSATTSNNPSLFQMALTGRTGGETLWIRAWDSTNNNGPGDFNFCAFEPCSITSITAGTQTACSPATNTYTQEVTVTYGANSGDLEVNGQTFTATGSPQTVLLIGLTADGADVDVTASFPNAGSCTLTETGLFTAATSCSIVCDILSITDAGNQICDGVSGTYSNDVVITYGTEPASGTLTVTAGGVTVNQPITGSPQTVTIEGLPTGIADVDVTASFSAEPTCTETVTAVFTARECNYCTAGSSSGCDEGVAGVVFAGISNTSGCSSSYTDYTAISGNVEAGGTYDIIVINGPEVYASDQGTVWIDFNNDADFDDSGESFTLTSSNQAVFTGSISIPAGATIGTTRMRIRVSYTGTPLPCGNNTWGEVEDYSLNIQTAGTLDASCGSMATNTPTMHIPVSLTATASCDESTGWTYYENPNATGDYLFAVEWSPDGSLSQANADAKIRSTISYDVLDETTNAEDASGASYGMARYWNIDLGGSTLDEPVNIKFFFDPAEITEVVNKATAYASANNGLTANDFSWFKTPTGAYDESQITAADFQDNVELLNGTISDENGNAYVQFDGLTSFSGGTGAAGVGAGFLPAEITSFEGKAMEKTNMLTWETASEQNVEKFVVQRSVNGLNNWVDINSIAARGNSTELVEYQLEDMSPVSSAYYRLRVVDFDGSNQLSKLIQITRKSTHFDIVNITPNPTNDITVVTFEALENARVSGKLMDITGKTISILSQDAVEGLNTLEVDLRAAPSGIYFLTLNNGVSNVTQRVIKN